MPFLLHWCVTPYWKFAILLFEGKGHIDTLAQIPYCGMGIVWEGSQEMDQ